MWKPLTSIKMLFLIYFYDQMFSEPINPPPPSPFLKKGEGYINAAMNL